MFEVDPTALDASQESQSSGQNPQPQKRKTRKIWFLVVLLGILLVASTVLTVKTVKAQWDDVKPEMVYKQCKVEFQNGPAMTGTREFVYQYRTVLGFKVHVKDSVMEKTYVNVNGEPLTIIGVNRGAENWFAVHMGPGEKNLLLLKEADTYSFVLHDKKDMAAVVRYEDFCK